MTTNESKLNETLTKVFGYIDWFREYDNATTDVDKKNLLLRYTTEVSTHLLESKVKTEKYFDEILDQPIYMTPDYIRLRKFLIHWYAAYNSAVKQEQQISDINFIDKSLLLQSLGYNLYGEHSDVHQRTLCTQLSDMYAQKGTPLCLAKVLSLLDVSNFTIFEYWLDRDPGDNALRFNPIPVDDVSYNTGMTLEARPAKPYNSVINADPHWYIEEAEIEAAEAEGQLGLPSMSPYIGIISANDWVRDSKMVNAYVNRIVVDTYDKFLNDPTYDISQDQRYYFYQIAGNISLLELYLAIGFTYNELYGRTNIQARNNIDEMVPHWNGDEQVVLSEVQFITEFNDVYKRTYDRDERQTLLEKSKTDWQTLNPITAWTHAEASIVLEDVNLPLKNLCLNMIASQQGFDFLKDLLLVLDYYIKHDLGLTSYTSLFMLYDPLQENRESLDKVFNFFKPYPTRLIEAISYLVINDVPGDCFATKEIYNMEIFHRIYDMYNNLGDLLRQRIFDRYHDIAGRANCPTMFCDLLNQIIIDRHMEMDLNIEDKLLKIHIDETFVEIYTLFIDMVKVSTRDKLGWDRYGFNDLHEPGEFPLPSGTVHIVNMLNVLNKVKSDYTSYYADKLINFLAQQAAEWYVLSNDTFNIQIIDPHKELILPLIMKDTNMYHFFEKTLEDYNLSSLDRMKIIGLFAEWCVIAIDEMKIYYSEYFKEDILQLIMKDVDMYTHKQKVYDISSSDDDDDYNKRLVTVDHSVIYRDNITIIQNDR